MGVVGVDSDPMEHPFPAVRDEPGRAKTTRWLVADVGPARLAVDAERALEVFVLPPCAPVPHAPRWVRGALVRAGQVVTVVDLGALVGLAERVGDDALLGVRLDDPELAVALAVVGVSVVDRPEPPPDARPLDVDETLAALRAGW